MTGTWIFTVMVVAFGSVVRASVDEDVSRRPFAPLPVDAQVAFKEPTTIFAGYPLEVKSVTGARCELNFGNQPKDIKLGPSAALVVRGGHLQRIGLQDSRAYSYVTNAIGETGAISKFSKTDFYLRRTGFLNAMAAYGGRPERITSNYRVGALQVETSAGLVGTLLCVKIMDAGGEVTVPTVPSLGELQDLFTVVTGD